MYVHTYVLTNTGTTRHTYFKIEAFQLKWALLTSGCTTNAIIRCGLSHWELETIIP